MWNACLGRILYTTGDVAGAVRLFLGLVRGSAAFSYNARLLQDTTAKIPGNDKLYLDDFRVAYSVSSEIWVYCSGIVFMVPCSISSRLSLKKLVRHCCSCLSSFVRLLVYG